MARLVTATQRAAALSESTGQRQEGVPGQGEERQGQGERSTLWHVLRSAQELITLKKHRLMTGLLLVPPRSHPIRLNISVFYSVSLKCLWNIVLLA